MNLINIVFKRKGELIKYMARSKNNKNQVNQKQLSEIDNINKSINDVLDKETTDLFGMPQANNEIAKLHNAYHEIISSDKQNILSSKASDVSTYGFVANAIAGGRYGYDSMKMTTGDPSRDKWLNRSRLEKAFTSGDAQMMSYFLSTNSDIIHIYDEIDSICAYIYQLDEAVDVIRDNVLSSDSPGELINCNIEFPGIPVENSIEYVDIVKEAFGYQNINKKLSTLIIPKMVKYGLYYIIVVPYSEIGYKLKYVRTTSATVMFESVTIDESIMPDITSLYEFVEFDKDDEYSQQKNQKLPKYVMDQLDNIRHNISLLEIDETGNGVPDIFESGVMEDFNSVSDKVKNAANDALKKMSEKSRSSSKSKKSQDGVIDESKFEELQGCHIQMVDPRQLRPIKIFDYTLGYYYFENYDYTKMGTSITDLLSNQMNFNEQNMVIDNLVNSVISKLQYGDVLKGDQQFRTMVLNCLLYAERRDNPIRIKFISPEYVVPFTTNEDEHGNGQPVLLRSLFYGRLYTSLLLFNITAIITKSTDTEFYWLKSNALDQQYSNQVSDIIDQMKASNVDPLQIANGDILHGNNAINKRYYMNAGTSGERPFDMEVVSGQQIDIHNDLLTDLRKMAIGAIGVPSAMIDLLEEVEYATQLSMANIKHLKRCNSIQTDVDPSLTELMKTIVKYNYPNVIPDDILDTMKITLKRSKVNENSITSQQLGDSQSTATTMVETFLASNDTNPPEITNFVKAIMIKEVTVALTPSAPWGLLNDIYEESIIKARKQAEEQRIQSGDTGESNSEM